MSPGDLWSSDLLRSGPEAIGAVGSLSPAPVGTTGGTSADHVPAGGSLAGRLDAALAGGPAALDRLRGAVPTDWRDQLLVVLRIHDLHLAPLRGLRGAERWQHHPVVAGLKWSIEERLLAAIERRTAARAELGPGARQAEPVAVVRAIALADRVPAVYRWLAEQATPEQLRAFLALEGGPDGGFDDLVAICQVGLDGEAKLELARNYWDEMGRGHRRAVHTELHRRLGHALGLPAPRRSALPVAALERAALSSLLATNRWLQPELVGALGLIELQAGPRCRQVVAGLRRIGAPPDALPFYEEHAATDPVHGKHWLDNVIAPLAEERPTLAERLVRGARWRAAVNDRFLDAAARAVGAPVLRGDRLRAAA